MSTKVFEPQRRDFFEVLNTRKTIRKYTLDKPPIEAIKIIADAGRHLVQPIPRTGNLLPCLMTE